jgi:murein DD-endopeptidase MepM/ murein hydrolase activator NlpD
MRDLSVMMKLNEFGVLCSAVNKHSFREWIFQPGMAFGDSIFWWETQQKKRPRSHEGIDFFCYEDSDGRSHYLDQSLVPAPCAGRVVALCEDFLGQSVFVTNDQENGSASIYVLAHINAHVQVGQKLKQGDVVGQVGSAQGQVPAHLHVSLILGNWRYVPVPLSWKDLIAQQKLQFSQPFFE